MLLDKILRPVAANEPVIATLTFRVIQESSLAPRKYDNPDFSRVNFVRDPDKMNYYRLLPQRYQVFFRPRPHWALEDATFSIQPVIEAKYIWNLALPGSIYELERCLVGWATHNGTNFWENILNQCQGNKNHPTVEIRGMVVGNEQERNITLCGITC
jgi:hypothetical protein